MADKVLLYEDFAELYDEVYAERESKRKAFSKESRLVQRVAKERGVLGKEVLDVACGTGIHARLFVKAGFSVMGVDLHKGMLRVARKKVPQARFVQGNMRTFSLKKRFSIVTCFFTSLGYMLTKKDVVCVLKNFKKHLSEDGFIVFDCPTNAQGGSQDIISLSKGLVIYDFVLQKNNSVLINLFWAIKNKKKYAVHKESHLIKAYTVAEWESMIKQAGLQYELRFEESSDRPTAICWV